MLTATQRNPAMTTQDAAISTIALTVLRLETLDTRNSDSLDFHKCFVESIKEALEAAYTQGLAANKSAERAATGAKS
jgi:hypothetical protein